MALCSACLVNSQASAQDSVFIDSLKKELISEMNDTSRARHYVEIGKSLLHNTPEEAIVYLDSAYSAYEELNIYKGISRVIAYKANLYYNQGDFDKAKSSLNESVQLLLENGDSLRAAIISSNSAILYKNDGQLDSAQLLLDGNLKIFIRQNDDEHIARTYLLLSSIAETRGYKKQALDLLYQALEKLRNIGLDSEIGMALLSMGALDSSMDEFERALSSFKEAEVCFRKAEYTQHVSQAINYQGVCHLNMSQVEVAKDLFTRHYYDLFTIVSFLLDSKIQSTDFRHNKPTVRIVKKK